MVRVTDWNGDTFGFFVRVRAWKQSYSIEIKIYSVARV